MYIMQSSKRNKYITKIHQNLISTVILLMPAISFAASMPDYYSESGFNANRGYETQQAIETIEPFSGGLQLQNVDLVLPGNGGIDIVVRRNYRAISKPAATGNVNYLGNRTVLGIGWDIHFGRIWSADTSGINDTLCGIRNVSSQNNPVLELADGTTKRLLDENLTPGSNRYVTKDRWIGKCLASGGLEVFSPDGLKYTFGFAQRYSGVFAWHVTQIEDKSNNKIQINYHPRIGTQHALIDTVTSPDGRAIKFNYDSEIFKWAILLKSVTNVSANQSVNYAHHKHANFFDRFFMDRATKSDGSFSSYEYDERPSGGGALSPGHFNLKKMTNPQGTSTNYTFEQIQFSGNVFIATQVLKTKSVTGAGVQPGTWTYNYTPGLTSGIDETQIKSPNYCTKYKHKGVRQVLFGDVWQIGTLREKHLYNSTSCTGLALQSEIYTWDKSLVTSQNEFHRRENVVDIDTYQPVLKTKTITRNNSSFITNYSNFDQYGNPQTKIETGPSSSRTTTYTYNNLFNATTWLIGLADTTTITGIAGNINNDYYSLSFGTKAGKLQQTNRYGAITKYDYDTGGNLRTVTDPENKVITYTNYRRGVPQNEAHPEALNISRVVKLSTGTVTSETNGRGKTTSYLYDSLNRVKSITTPKTTDSNVTVNWSLGGRVKTVIRSGLTSITTNNGFGKPITVQTGPITKTYTYNAEGQLLFESYPSSTKGTTYKRDVLGRVTKITHPDLSFQQFTYRAGNKVDVRNEKGVVTTKTFRSYGDPDERYLMNEVVAGITTTYTRNKLGQVESISQGGKTRTYGYDTRHYLETITNPETGLTTFVRDNVGNMTTKKVGTSLNTVYAYDGLHRLKTINYPGEPAIADVTFIYDGNNNLDTVTRSNTIRKFTYDDNDNVLTQVLTVDGIIFPLAYDHDPLDNLNTITYPSGRVVNYAPNTLGQATQATPLVTSVTYHPNGTPFQTTYANGVVETKNLTPDRDWVDTVSATGVIDLNYGYDVRGNITSITNGLDPSKNLTMGVDGYDAVDRLVSVTGPWGAGSISYDALGNITSKNIGPFQLAYTYDLTSKRLNSTSGIVNNTYQYDVYGNIKNNGTDTFVFDDASNMVSATGSTNLVNTYDGKNILVKSVKNGTTTYHLYDQNYNLLGEYSATGTMRKEYVRLNGKVIATIKPIPSVPGAVSITTPDINGDYSISWGSSTGELSHYELGISTDGTCTSPTAFANSNSINYGVTNQADGTYYYCVRACNADACSTYQYSGASCAPVGATSAPCIPNSLTAPTYNNTGSFAINWISATTNVTHFELYEATNSTFTAEALVYSGPTLTTTLINKTDGDYYYRIIACNNTVCSPAVQAANFTKVVIPPSAPASITAPANTNNLQYDVGYTVSWGAATGTVTRYELFESTTADFAVQKQVYTGLNLSAVLNVSTEGNYYYRVIACNQGECSAYTTLATPVLVNYTPAIPGLVTVPATNNTGHYTINWLAAPAGFITHYELFESNKSDFTFERKVFSGNTLSADLGYKLDGTFYYRVRACNGPFCSTYQTGVNPTVVKGSPYTAALIAIITSLLLD